MTPLFITVPLAMILLLFCVVFTSVGCCLMFGAVVLNVRSWWRREPWLHKVGSLFGGALVAAFGWIIVRGSFVTGADIIDGLITRFLA